MALGFDGWGSVRDLPSRGVAYACGPYVLQKGKVGFTAWVTDFGFRLWAFEALLGSGARWDVHVIVTGS